MMSGLITTTSHLTTLAPWVHGPEHPCGDVDSVHRSTRSLWATDATAELLEDPQFTLNEGACMEAATTGHPLLAADVVRSPAVTSAVAG